MLKSWLVLPGEHAATTAPEYAVLAAAIALLAVASMSGVGSALGNMFTNVANGL